MKYRLSISCNLRKVLFFLQPLPFDFSENTDDVSTSVEQDPSDRRAARKAKPREENKSAKKHTRKKRIKTREQLRRRGTLSKSDSSRDGSGAFKKQITRTKNS